MNNLEEQAIEVEALEAIFEEDFQKTPTGCSIKLYPYPKNSKKANHVGIALNIEFGSTYPTDPLASIVAEKILGLNPDLLANLNKIVYELSRELSGQSCIFDITESIRDFLVQNNVKEITSLRDRLQEQIEQEEFLAKQKREEEERIQAEKDAEEERRREAWSEDLYDPTNISTIEIPPNTLCTDENFHDWSRKFLEEQEKRKALLIEQEKIDTRPTGRQIFIQELISTFEDDNEAQYDGEVSPNEDEVKDVFWFNDDIYDDDDDDELDGEIYDPDNENTNSAFDESQFESALDEISKDMTENTNILDSKHQPVEKLQSNNSPKFTDKKEKKSKTEKSSKTDKSDKKDKKEKAYKPKKPTAKISSLEDIDIGGGFSDFL